MSKKTFSKELNNPAEDKSDNNTQGTVATTTGGGSGTATVGNTAGGSTGHTRR